MATVPASVNLRKKDREKEKAEAKAKAATTRQDLQVQDRVVRVPHGGDRTEQEPQKESPSPHHRAQLTKLLQALREEKRSPLLPDVGVPTSQIGSNQVSLLKS
ncbi:hypothetical protein CYMTET_10695 [Cymbomonas tetramitiformis]|uniref:Uncharacterized protein n=1 Tax=Cymbomonas tetramitiformis TaxID=36881 RepID=A0AAE0GFG4_9CHLO|nr:hypothetical protein CYMTET_14969 [Cymbomonas tetramitiformis]KAK3281519.1 hypothetical protein CYMTET_10695 [Cymbomonas tetramitiformis]